MRSVFTLALVLVAALPLSANGPAGEESIVLEFDRGFVTIRASDASVADILKRYGLVGAVEILHIDALPPSRITIALDKVPERTALDILTRSGGGYLATYRIPDNDHQSYMNRIAIFRAIDRSTVSSPPPAEPQVPTGEPVEPAPGEVRRRLGPDGQPMADDQEDAPR